MVPSVPESQNLITVHLCLLTRAELVEELASSVCAGMTASSCSGLEDDGFPSLYIPYWAFERGGSVGRGSIPNVLLQLFCLPPLLCSGANESPRPMGCICVCCYGAQILSAQAMK